jgi:oxygen-independent coproporphyrinogen-3 oxidase
MAQYVDLLLQEALFRRNEIPEPVETVYCGGGTPSLLSPALWKKLFAGLREIFDFTADIEFTSEANPGTVTESWLEAALDSGVNRLSLGMQASQDRLLKLLGRIHSHGDVEQSVLAAKSAGFDHLNLDLIFGLPEQNGTDWKETLLAAMDLEPDHLSAYGLIPEENTPLWTDLQSGALQLPEPEDEREMYEEALQITSGHGFHQYEISNFARPGSACRHNIGYWSQVPYIGLGVSAASMVFVRQGPEGMKYLRKTNVNSLSHYFRGISSGHPALGEEAWVQGREAQFETMMLGLRKTEGVSEADFFRMHGVSLEAGYGPKLEKLAEEGLLYHDGGFWKLTRLGMDLQNTVLVDLLDS